MSTAEASLSFLVLSENLMTDKGTFTAASSIFKDFRQSLLYDLLILYELGRVKIIYFSATERFGYVNK